MAHIKPKKREGMTSLVDKLPGEPQYPYGTELTLEDEVAEALNAGKLEVGEEIEIRGKAFVKRKSENTPDDADDGKKTETSLTIQFTEINVVQNKSDKVTQMYET